MVIAFDKGDEFYDNEEGQTELKVSLTQSQSPMRVTTK